MHCSLTRGKVEQKLGQLGLNFCKRKEAVFFFFFIRLYLTTYLTPFLLLKLYYTGTGQPDLVVGKPAHSRGLGM